MGELSIDYTKLKFCGPLSRYFLKILVGLYLAKEEANFSAGLIL
jgi:hypothetical protein